MNHIGVLAALMEKDMLPRIISGTSAGSIVAAVCCTRTDDELPQLLNDFIHGDFNVFQDSLNPESVYDHIARLLKIGTFLTLCTNNVVRRLVGYFLFDKSHAIACWGSNFSRSICRAALCCVLTLESDPTH